MRKKYTGIIIISSLIVLFIVYKIILFAVWNSQITETNAEPQVKLSQLINISEERVKYSRSNYINKEIAGFEAFIDENHFITVTKLGKISNGYRIIETKMKPDNDTQIFGLGPSLYADGRYVNLKLLPFKINEIFFYFENGNISKINQTKFYEIECTYSYLNISFEGENRKDFGYIGLPARKSISFIKHNDNLYILNLCARKNKKFSSLHNLLDIKNG